jgi:hypothetical protein
MAITSFAQFKLFMDNILSQNGQSADVGHSPHDAFWDNLTYQQFVNGNVPGVDPPVKILIVGNSAQSNLILSLLGSGPLFDDPNTGYGRMPADGPPFFTADQIAEIAAWIDAGCPQ